MDPLSLIGVGGSIASGALNLFGQAGAQRNSGSALQLAMQDYELRKRQMDQQYELATAGQTDARGNQTRYVPGRGWVTDLTPQSQSTMNRSDAVLNNQYSESLGRGVDERRMAFERRLEEGSTASPLLAQMKAGYGAPSREGVGGANRIAGVTGATEGADHARSGYNAAALRTGSGSAPLQHTIAGIDRGATQGIRSALARGDADEGALFQEMTDQFNQGKLNPYNMLASRASNVENMPFNPESLSGGIDAMAFTRAKGAPGDLARGSTAFAGAANPVIAAMLSQKTPQYDKFLGGLTETLSPFFKKSSAPDELYRDNYSHGRGAGGNTYG